MIAELEHPIETLRGNLTKEHYARVQYGKEVIQRRPKRDRAPTEAQKRAREAFAKKYAGKHWLLPLPFPLPLRYHLPKIRRRYANDKQFPSHSLSYSLATQCVVLRMKNID